VQLPDMHRHAHMHAKYNPENCRLNTNECQENMFIQKQEHAKKLFHYIGLCLLINFNIHICISIKFRFACLDRLYTTPYVSLRISYFFIFTPIFLGIIFGGEHRITSPQVVVVTG